MLIDLHRFIAAERGTWVELEEILNHLQRSPNHRMSVEEAMRFHYLYEKVSSDLAKVTTFASEPATKAYLESLTARAYAEIHETRDTAARFRPGRWFLVDFPRVFRKHLVAFWVAVAVMVAGGLFGGFAVSLDPEAKEMLIPPQFAHLLGDPAKRVQEEESMERDAYNGARATFSTSLMTNNIRVSILTLAAGVTAGIGTVVLLFYNGILLGLVAFDYVGAGQGVFLLGWLLPHGVVEIPAILIAGQAGLVLGRSIIGRGDRVPLRDRLRNIRGDLAMLILGVAVLLVWAGLVEAFLSQYHEPVIPYWLKIGFGVLELGALVFFLGWRRGDEEAGG